MKGRMATTRVLVMAGCGILLLALVLLPLMGLMSYRWDIADVMRKLPRLLSSGVQQAVAYVLLALMTFTPLVVILREATGHATPRWLLALPAIAALTVTAALLATSKPVSPAPGLWLYLVIAVGICFLRRMPEKK